MTILSEIRFLSYFSFSEQIFLIVSLTFKRFLSVYNFLNDLVYIGSPSARVCKSDTDWLLMLCLFLKDAVQSHLSMRSLESPTKYAKNANLVFSVQSRTKW